MPPNNHTHYPNTGGGRGSAWSIRSFARDFIHRHIHTWSACASLCITSLLLGLVRAYVVFLFSFSISHYSYRSIPFRGLCRLTLTKQCSSFTAFRWNTRRFASVHCFLVSRRLRRNDTSRGTRITIQHIHSTHAKLIRDLIWSLRTL